MMPVSLTRTIRRILVGRKQQFVFVANPDVTLPPLTSIALYIHIPFCKNMCPYCPYNRVAYEKNLVAPYTEAVLREIEQYSLTLGSVEVPSIYVGGGTPTNLIDELGLILQSVRQRFAVVGDICVETSPSDLSREVVGKLKDFGVDLISVGVQSFGDDSLRALGRNYDSAGAKTALQLVLSSDFKSVNVDLMFALPGQGIEDVLSDLRETVEMNLPQVTAYPLFTFPYSSVGRYLRAKNVTMPNMFSRRRMYKAIYDFYLRNGYQRVSVWGFRKGDVPTYSSVTRDEYIGIGAGACTSLPKVFYLNTFSVRAYIDTALSGKLPIALSMSFTPQLRKYYWLYWQFYGTRMNKRDLYEIFPAKSLRLRAVLGVMKFLGLYRENESTIELTERGSFYVHLLQNYLLLDYINRVWTIAMTKPWPRKIEI